MTKWTLPEGRMPMSDADIIASLTRSIAETALDQRGRVKELEAKLAAAFEALSSIVEGCEASYPPSHSSIKHEARAAMAEIMKGETDE
tara:strand:+ start:647 stop:910 length:264 start_codon:yes stop_codon:yes gene_type:complete